MAHAFASTTAASTCTAKCRYDSSERLGRDQQLLRLRLVHIARKGGERSVSVRRNPLLRHRERLLDHQLARLLARAECISAERSGDRDRLGLAPQEPAPRPGDPHPPREETRRGG